MLNFNPRVVKYLICVHCRVIFKMIAKVIAWYCSCLVVNNGLAVVFCMWIWGRNGNFNKFSILCPCVPLAWNCSYVHSVRGEELSLFEPLETFTPGSCTHINVSSHWAPFHTRFPDPALPAIEIFSGVNLSGTNSCWAPQFWSLYAWKFPWHSHNLRI